RSTLATNGNFPDGVYTYAGMVTNTGKSAGTYLTGYIQMPSNPVRATTTTTSTTTTSTTVSPTTTTTIQ
ncbi:MAG: chitinase, partial [Actinobacteria bacterium]|nr:chitinase [Actinomycetota bacterium]